MTPIAEDPRTWNYYTTPEIKKQIDFNLEDMASLESNKGIDSTEEEKSAINKLMNDCLSRIKDLDIFFWNRLCPSKEEEEIK